jgi:hypothetical protein
MAERKFAALAELRRRPDPPSVEEPAAPDQVPETPPVEARAPDPEPAPPPLVAAPPIEPAPPPSTAPVQAPNVPVAAVPAVIAPEPQKGRGRPPGKRSDPDWAPRTILMRSKIHRRVSIILLERDDGPDLSELVDQLLSDWISEQT